ncbi:recombinase family protein [Nocardia sp. BSTN01]|uniref:recombinase family protein n=1 Tax=Nocardia sp. BSTN01 TaxID=2783665 RepID=UPI00189040D4|nr:recombinase family protein [Nocardia sp. BSTN01]MBF4996697.1 recombinase family protein [Nocardia sp. BSTN01]
MTAPITTANDVAFTPAALFLSVAAVTEAEEAAGGEPIRIQLQREAGFRTAAQRQLGIVKEFVEIGTPAMSLRGRPVLRRLLAHLEQHPDIRYVIFPSTRRFALTSAHAQLLAKHFRRLDVRVLLPNQDSQHPVAQSFTETWA